MKKLIALLGWLGMSAAALAQTLTSPNGNLQMDFHLSAGGRRRCGYQHQGALSAEDWKRRIRYQK